MFRKCYEHNTGVPVYINTSKIEYVEDRFDYYKVIFDISTLYIYPDENLFLTNKEIKEKQK